MGVGSYLGHLFRDWTCSDGATKNVMSVGSNASFSSLSWTCKLHNFFSSLQWYKQGEEQHMNKHWIDIWPCGHDPFSDSCWSYLKLYFILNINSIIQCDSTTPYHFIISPNTWPQAMVNLFLNTTAGWSICLENSVGLRYHITSIFSHWLNLYPYFITSN